MRTGAAGAGAGAAAAVAAGGGGAGAGGAADSDSEDSSVLAFAQEAPVLENGGAYEEVGMPGSHDSDDMAAARVLAASFIPTPPSPTPIPPIPHCGPPAAAAATVPVVAPTANHGAMWVM